MPTWYKNANSSLNAADGIKRGHVGLGQGLWLKHLLECSSAGALEHIQLVENPRAGGGWGRGGGLTCRWLCIPPGSWRPYSEGAGGQDETLETEHFGFAANWNSSRKQTEIWLSFCAIHLQKSKPKKKKNILSMLVELHKNIFFWIAIWAAARIELSHPQPSTRKADKLIFS